MEYLKPTEENIDEIVKGIAERKVLELDEDVRRKYNVTVLKGIQGDNYLTCYYQTMEDIQQHDIIGPADTFIKASCMCKALIQEKIISFKADEETPKEVLFLNFIIAFTVACEMIKEPVTFKKDENGIWIALKQPKLRGITVPRGTVENSPLKQRILEAMARDYLNNRYFSAMQFSNFLQLLYLYNI